jgi:hypothetical protein
MKTIDRSRQVSSPLATPPLSVGTIVARLVHPLTSWFPKNAPSIRDRQQRAQPFPLARGEVQQIVHHDVDEIHVLTGVVWLTTTPGDDDIVLRASDSFQLPKSGPIVIEALKDASVLLL